MSKFCYYDHSMATSSILEAARYFVNKTFPEEADLRMCEGLLHAYRLVSEHKQELAEQLTPPVAKEGIVEVDMSEADMFEADMAEEFGA